MNEEQQRIKIAEACGWRCIKTLTTEDVDFDSRSITYTTGLHGYRKGSEELNLVPDYPHDLNAMHEAEKVIVRQSKENAYWFFIRQAIKRSDGQCSDCGFDYFDAVHATSHQRAEAFLKTLNLWEE